jgi:hypothetical protein
LIIRAIRRDRSGSDQIDDPFNLSRPDPSGADQIDAEHQATDLAVGVRILAARHLMLSRTYQLAVESLEDVASQ